MRERLVIVALVALAQVALVGCEAPAQAGTLAEAPRARRSLSQQLERAASPTAKPSAPLPDPWGLPQILEHEPLPIFPEAFSAQPTSILGVPSERFASLPPFLGPPISSALLPESRRVSAGAPVGIFGLGAGVPGAPAGSQLRETDEAREVPRLPVGEPFCPQQEWDPTMPSRGPLTDRFGWSAWRGRNHDGIDVGTRIGDPVWATSAGTVVKAEYDGGYGNVIFVEHPNGYLSTYNHLDKIHVEVGDTVCKAQKIGEAGDTGKSTGPHLHFEIWVPGDCSYPEVGNRCPVDPYRWL
jgi:murein DD-endopeptidase MepM/ murein hydrolase activator NlpD